MCAAGCSMRVAGVGRVVDIQLVNRCGKLRSVKSLNAAGRSLREAEVVESLINRCPGFDSTLR